MKKFALLPLAALLVMAGCQDIQKGGAAPTEPQIQAPGGVSLSVDVAPSTGKSTVCIAFEQRRDDASAAGDAEAVADLDTIIADTCN